MADLDKALATQLANIEKRTGKPLAELLALVRGSGLAKHGEKVAMLKTTLRMGHGDANTVVHLAARPEADGGAPGGAGPSAMGGTGAGAAGDPLDALYVGPRATLRPIHERLLAAMATFGTYETAPKKSYVSYRRRKQFAMIGPATHTRVELGLNIKTLPTSERCQALPPGQMCNYKVKLQDAAEVDAELVGWLRAAFDAAG